MAKHDERIEHMKQKYGAKGILKRILEEQGRIAELTETQLPLPT
jgi:hypothetical protein